MSARAKWTIRSAFGGGWCVWVKFGQETVGFFYGRNGGEWELSEDGTVGRQTVGTGDVQAPRDPEKFGRWVRRQIAGAVADMRADAERSLRAEARP